MNADSSFAIGPVSATMEGTVGYSECADGNDQTSCPFYLGSLELELTEPLTLALVCDSVPQTYELEELHIRLAQPAFGIAEQETAWRAFPPSSLAFEADGILNEIPFWSRQFNQEPVYASASAGSIELSGSVDGAWVRLELPCGGGVADALVWLDFEEVGRVGGPPEVTIDVPASVSCPDEIDLDYSMTDQEQDIESVRWLVDGVLMHEDVEAIDFTASHKLTVVVRDSRGATTTSTKVVSCQ